MPQQICYFPTSIILLDDDREFIDSIVEVFYDNTKFSLKGTSSSENVVKMVKASKDLATFLPAYKTDEEIFQHAGMAINIQDISNLISCREKKDIISCVIVDYQMPGIDGLSLLQGIENENIVKILLTGETLDKERIIKALNEGIIDYYISKNSLDFINEVKQCIAISQEKYFFRQTKILSKMIKLSSGSSSALNEKEFAVLFQDLVNSYNVVEYYLIDEIGSNIMINSNNEKYILFITTLEHSNALCDLIDDDNYQSSHMVRDIRNGEKILCYYAEDNVEFLSVKKWDAFVCPAQKLMINNKEFLYHFDKYER